MEEIKDMQISNEYEKPIVFIIGSTASGKTKLSLEICKHDQNFEIINADSMQIYKQANILTAKASLNDQSIVPHHLIDILDLERQDFNRKDYCMLACKEIKDLNTNNKLAMIVGGTNYYIESLLFTDYNDNVSSDEEEKDEKFVNDNESLIDPIVQLESADWMQKEPREKYELLNKIDPIIAAKLHQNDVRRVENYIKIYFEEQILPSKKICKLNEKRGIRFKNPLILWVKFKSKEIFMKFIEHRVNKMIDIEGIREIINIFNHLDNMKALKINKGVLQSIGYKEFLPFYEALKNEVEEQAIFEDVDKYIATVNSLEDLNSNVMQIFLECKARLIIQTQRYAKKQITWIQNRLACETSLVKSRVFLLEFDSLESFDEQVVSKAKQILKDYLEGNLSALSEESKEIVKAINDSLISWKKYYCEVCECYLNGEKEWLNHANTKRHKKSRQKKDKMKKNYENMLKYKDILAEKSKD